MADHPRKRKKRRPARTGRPAPPGRLSGRAKTSTVGSLARAPQRERVGSAPDRSGLHPKRRMATCSSQGSTQLLKPANIDGAARGSLRERSTVRGHPWSSRPAAVVLTWTEVNAPLHATHQTGPWPHVHRAVYPSAANIQAFSSVKSQDFPEPEIAGRTPLCGWAAGAKIAALPDSLRTGGGRCLHKASAPRARLPARRK